MDDPNFGTVRGQPEKAAREALAREVFASRASIAAVKDWRREAAIAFHAAYAFEDAARRFADEPPADDDVAR
jgi:hypothetical protein